jgi:hypothetical protein
MRHICNHNECNKTSTFGVKWGSPIMCVQHKTAEMSDVVHKKCRHNIRISRCKECGGSEVCPHGKRDKTYCKECGGSQICKHGKRVKTCKLCGGSDLCKSSWCETHANSKYEGYCLNCFIHLFPDRPNSRNYKTKERAVVEYILKEFPLEKYTWIADKKIEDGCSGKRPDLILDLGYQVIIIEIDENQHQTYDCSCENKRLMLLSQDVDHRPIIFIRFNPDAYIDTESRVITSCWGVNKSGICVIKKSKEREWDQRLTILNQNIKYWCDSNNITFKTIEVIQLFYDCNFNNSSEKANGGAGY